MTEETITARIHPSLCPRYAGHGSTFSFVVGVIVGFIVALVVIGA